MQCTVVAVVFKTAFVFLSHDAHDNSWQSFHDESNAFSTRRYFCIGTFLAALVFHTDFNISLVCIIWKFSNLLWILWSDLVVLVDCTGFISRISFFDCLCHLHWFHWELSFSFSSFVFFPHCADVLSTFLYMQILSSRIVLGHSGQGEHLFIENGKYIVI